MSNCRRGHNQSIKQYSTLELLCTYSDDYDAPLSLAGITIQSDMRSESGQLIDSLDVTIVDSSAGVFMMRPTISKLPVGIMSIDVVFKKDGKIVTSDTFTIDIEPAITDPRT